MTQAADDMDLETAHLDPGSIFTSPEELCESPLLSMEQKLDLLQHWAADAREPEVAESEGMGGSETSLFADRIDNLNDAGITSGDLVLQLWARQAPYTGGSLTGWKLAEFQPGIFRWITSWHRSGRASRRASPNPAIMRLSW
jgi:hypothetical protein